MKLIKMLPLVALALSVAASSAFAEVGKNGSDVEHICEKVTASLIKQEHKSPVTTVAPAATDVKHEPQNGSTAM